jgi:hypothetical protein
MRSRFNKSFAAGVVLAVLAASPALSSPITATVDFWNYNGSTTTNGTLANSTNAILSSAPDVIFTYNGDLNWGTASPTNSVGSFLALAGPTAVTVSGWSSPTNKYATEADWLASSMSTGGDGTTSFFQLTGTLSSGGTYFGTITHDDGVTYVVNNSTLVNSPVETSQDTDAFSLSGAFSNATYTLDYVEGNGAPAVLNLTAAIPEASTWAMMIMGFFGVGFMAYRRQNNQNKMNFRMA